MNVPQYSIDRLYNQGFVRTGQRMVLLALEPGRASDIEKEGKNNMTKIDIISGFLGAGKTTFIKKLLEEAISGEQVVLIENEFGEIGIDGGFLKD